MTARSTKLADLLAPLSLPLLMLASLTVLAASQDSTAAAETLYLALLAAAVLLPVAVLAVSPSFDLALPTLFVATVVWVVPPGPSRGASVGALLVLTLALALGRRWATTKGRIDWRIAIPAALALGFLFRADELLAVELEPTVLVRLFGLPIASAVAMVILAERQGPAPTLLAAAAALLSTNGWSTESALALVALAGVALVEDEDLPWIFRGAAILLPIAAAFLREPRVGVVLIASVLVFVFRSRPLALLAVAIASLLVAWTWPEARAWALSLDDLAWLPLLLPAALATARESWRLLAVTLALAVMALRLLPPELALPPVVAVAALRSPWRQPQLAVQGVWSAALVIGAAVMSCYPWLRASSVEHVLERFALGADWLSALTVVAVLGVASVALRALNRSLRRLRVSPVILGLCLLGIGAARALPPRSLPVLEQDVITLDHNSSRWTTKLAEKRFTREVVLHSYLAASAELPAGTPVASLTVFSGDGHSEKWVLKAGEDSGEWAARRPDVAALPGLSAPPAWLSWVTHERFFAQRYRGSHLLSQPLSITTISLERDSTLPVETAIVAFQVELR